MFILSMKKRSDDLFLMVKLLVLPLHHQEEGIKHISESMTTLRMNFLVMLIRLYIYAFDWDIIA